MSESSVGMLVLLGITLVASLIMHLLLRNFFIACFIAAVVSTGLFEVLATIHLGHVDKFMGIAIIVALVLTFTVSAMVGFVMRKFRK
jgi:hypothetical protein